MTISAQTARNVAATAAVIVLISISGALGDLGTTVVTLVGIAAAISSFVAPRRLPKGARHPWYIIAVAISLTLISSALREQYHTLGDLSDARSLVPDFFSVPGYVLIVIGLSSAMRIRRKSVGGRMESLLDGALAALAVFLLAWVFVIYPATRQASASGWVTLSLLAYPPISASFVVFTSELAFARGSRRGSAFVGAVATMTLLVTGDLLFMLVDAGLTSMRPEITQLPYGLVTAAILYYTLHPTFVEFGEPLPADDSPPSPGRLAVVSMALSLPVLVMCFHDFRDATDRLVAALVALLLTAIATVRTVRALYQQARSDRQLRYQATHDLLTGVQNRSGLVAHLRHLANRDVGHAVFFLDMDRFKLVNDAFGHHSGDELLMKITERLAEVCGPNEVLGRIGGDEFVVVTTATSDIDEAVAFAERLRSSVTANVVVAGNEVPVSFSIGVTTSAPDKEPDDLIREADTAMYQAKEAGRDAIMVFDRSMTDRIANRIALERDLHNALDREELELHYQPVVDSLTGKVIGFEALIRWNHPTRGTVPPLDFIPIAEEKGYIVEIGAWVLEQAVADLARWRVELPGCGDLWVSVNVSARQLLDADFVFMAQRALTRHRLPADALALEVTESMLIDEALMMQKVLTKIRAIGIRLSIDDFGTGYSSLAYVQRYPFNCVKIDRAFVELLDGAGSEHQLVGAIVAMADALGLSTIAEGVETLAQAQRLVELGCTNVQGYYYSRPLPAMAIPETIKRLGAQSLPSAVRLGS